MAKSRDPVDRWMDEVFGGTQPSLRESPAFEPVPTSSEIRADRTAQVARQIIEAEKEQRQADGARLRQARLRKEAQHRASKSGTSERRQPGEAD